MIRFIGSLPRKCIVAFSGGVDSVAITDFLINGKRDVSLAFFHHGTKTSDEALNFAKSFALDREVPLTVGHITGPKPSDESQEEYWRNCRYEFLTQFEDPIVTAHHLDDAVETWIFSSLHGASKLLPYRRGNVVRPFLVTPKSELISWAKKRDLQWIDDASNTDERYMRNLIRHRIMPEALRVNPGLRTVIKKKYLDTKAS